MSRTPQQTDDQPAVPVRTLLRPSTYRELTAHAALRRLTLAELLSKLADASLHPIDMPKPQTPRRRYTRLGATDREQVRRRAAHGEKHTTLAHVYGVSVATIGNIVKEQP